MSTKIVPTPGRVVWYRPTAADKVCRSGSEPLACIVAGVIPQYATKKEKREVEKDGAKIEEEVEVTTDEVLGYLCNLSGYDFLGRHFDRQNVPLVQADEPKPESCYCEWMPYQIGQAQSGAKQLEGPASGGMAPKDVKSNIDTLYANFRGLGQDFNAFKKDVTDALSSVRRDLGEERRRYEASEKSTAAPAADKMSEEQLEAATAPAPKEKSAVEDL